MNPAPLTWRHIFDCKVSGETIDATLKKAEEARYTIICHNGRLYTVPLGLCIGTINDIQPDMEPHRESS